MLFWIFSAKTAQKNFKEEEIRRKYTKRLTFIKILLVGNMDNYFSLVYLYVLIFKILKVNKNTKKNGNCQRFAFGWVVSKLCGLGQVILLFWASVCLFIKWGWWCLVHEMVVRTEWSSAILKAQRFMLRKILMNVGCSPSSRVTDFSSLRMGFRQQATAFYNQLIDSLHYCLWCLLCTRTEANPCPHEPQAKLPRKGDTSARTQKGCLIRDWGRFIQLWTGVWGQVKKWNQITGQGPVFLQFVGTNRERHLPEKEIIWIMSIWKSDIYLALGRLSYLLKTK